MKKLLSVQMRALPIAGTAAILLGVHFTTAPSLHGQDLVRSSVSGSDSPERVVITGSNVTPSKAELSNDPLASPSSVSVRTGNDLKRETIQSYGDIFRPVAGVSVSNYDQGNLSYGLSLRGFDAGNHGGDIAYTLDGVPVNLPSANVGTNGYDILSPLIPELIQSAAVFRGPFNERFGNFALGGAVDLRTVSLSPSLLSVTAGSFDVYRGLGVYGFDLGGKFSGYTALETDTQNGYRDNSEARTINSFTRLETPIFGGQGTAGFHAEVYSTSYGAPGYLNRALVENGTLSPRDAINNSDGGSLTELSFSTPVYLPSPKGDFFAALFVTRDLLKRWSDFDVVPMPNNTPNRLQVDDRWTAGGTIEKNWIIDQYGDALRLPTQVTVGVQSRSDLVSQGVYTAVDRTSTATRSLYDFTQHNAGAYARLQFQPLPWLKLEGGTRYDQFFYDISEKLSGTTISHTTGDWSPKAGAAITPVRGLSIFGNYGEGLRSPSAVDDLPGNPDLRTAKLKSVEAGFSYDTPPATQETTTKQTPGSKDGKGGGTTAAASDLPGPAAGTFHFLADVFYTTLSNEVVTGPDGATPVNLGRSRRRGLELEASYVAFHNRHLSLSVFANYSYVEALLTTGPVHQYVPDVARYHVNYGFDIQAPFLFDPASSHRFDLSVYHQIIGPQHLTGDGLYYTRTYTRLAARATYANTKLPGFNAFVGIVAYPDRRLDETAFDFGTDANGNELIGVSAKPLVNLQGGLIYSF